MIKCAIQALCWMCAVSIVAQTANGSALMPCPDCGCDVSRRALMCPNCGLRGDIIAEIAKTIPEPRIGDVLDVGCDGRMACALPVEMGGRHFAVLPLDCVLGVSQLKLRHCGEAVSWAVPELAVDAPIVRLQITATNLTYWVPGGTLAFAGNRFKPTGNEVASVVSPLVATNAFAITGREWQVLQPKQMKSHGRQVLKMLNGEQFEVPQRSHPYFMAIFNQRKEREQ